MPAVGPLLFAILLGLDALGELWSQQRAMVPEDLFRIERIGAISWSPDRRWAAMEMPQSGWWIDANIPTASIPVVDAASARIRTIAPDSAALIGFFGAAWAPDGGSHHRFPSERARPVATAGSMVRRNDGPR